MLRWVSEVVYELALPHSLSAMHLVFLISMMKKYIPDGSHKLWQEEHLTYLTRRRLCKFLTDMWKLSIGKKCFLWRCFGLNRELRRPRGSTRMTCGSTSIDSSLERMAIRGNSTPPCTLLLWAIIQICVSICLCVWHSVYPLRQIPRQNFLRWWRL